MDQPEVPTIFSRASRSLRDQRAAARQRGGERSARWLLDAMVEDVLERLAFVRMTPERAWIAGDLTGALEQALAAQGAEVTAPAPAELDEERPLAGGPFDLVISLARLDSVNDLPGALLHFRNALAPGGLMLAVLIGAGSLPALRHAMLAADGERPAPRIHPQVDSRAATALLERAGFSRQVVDSHALTVRYGALATLVADLRDQGLTGVLERRGPPLGQAALARARAAFAELAEADGKVPERFELLTLTGWR